MHALKGKIGGDSLAYKYDRLHEISTEASIRAKRFPPLTGANKIIADYLKDRRGNLLELGCGRGELLIQSHSDFDLKTGVDFSEVFVRDAILFTEKYALKPEKIRWMIHDISERWSFEDSYFDVVVSSACLEHVFDIYHVFRECNRVLKSGGYFYFAVPNIAYLKQRIRLLLGFVPVTASSVDLWWRDYWDGTHVHYFTAATLGMLCRENGFTVTGMTGSGKYRSWRAWWPALLCGELIVTARKI